MSLSNLCSYLDTGSNNWNQRTKPISKITIHHAAGIVSVQTMSKIMRTPGRTVSWNYAIGNDGQIGGYIDESLRAWTSSNRENDMMAVTIEVSNSVNGEPWSVSEAAYKSLLNLCEDICRRNNIRALEFTGNKSGNLTMHKFFAATGCPGPTLSVKFNDIAREINRRLGNPSQLVYVTNPESQNITAAGAVKTGSNAPITSLIDYTKINPYAVTIDRTVKTLDFDMLKASKVVMLCIEAGQMYDSAHVEMSNFRNPNLDSIIAEAKRNNIPYALYMQMTAKTDTEIDKELYELKLVLRKYVPQLGFWLMPNFQSEKSRNDIQLRKYYEALVKIGLSGKLGIYCTRQQLQKISWESMWCNMIYLWLNDHVEETADIDTLLTPEFFMT